MTGIYIWLGLLTVFFLVLLFGSCVLQDAVRTLQGTVSRLDEKAKQLDRRIKNKK